MPHARFRGVRSLLGTSGETQCGPERWGCRAWPAESEAETNVVSTAIYSSYAPLHWGRQAIGDDLNAPLILARDNEVEVSVQNVGEDCGTNLTANMGCNTLSGADEKARMGAGCAVVAESVQPTAATTRGRHERERQTQAASSIAWKERGSNRSPGQVGMAISTQEAKGPDWQEGPRRQGRDGARPNSVSWELLDNRPRTQRKWQQLHHGDGQGGPARKRGHLQGVPQRRPVVLCSEGSGQARWKNPQYT